MTLRHDNNATPPQTAPDAATYKASENTPSVRTLLPVPKFPASAVPESTETPATFSADQAGQVRADNPASQLHLQTRQVVLSPLQPPTRFDPKMMRHVPVELPLVDDAKPATARPVHDGSKAQTV
jgi:hypothetical protein